MTERRSTMKIYTSTGTLSTIEECNRRGIGLLMVADWRDPGRWPYFAIDNGCYSAYSRGVEWDPAPFLRNLDRCRERGMVPDFIVIPDKVASRDSLEFSGEWYPRLAEDYPGFRMYLPVQDGMEDGDVERFCATHRIDGLFVGGSMVWKLETMATWARWAHDHGMGCHVGRIGPVRRMMMAELAGADSIDSTTWVQRKGALTRYMDRFEKQTRLDIAGHIEREKGDDLMEMCDRCMHNTPISGCVHEKGWEHYYNEDFVTECEFFEEEKE